MKEKLKRIMGLFLSIIMLFSSIFTNFSVVKAAETITYDKVTSVVGIVSGEKYVITLNVTPINQTESRTIAMKTAPAVGATYNFDYYDHFDSSTPPLEGFLWTIESYEDGYSLKAEGIGGEQNYLNLLSDMASLGSRQKLTIAAGATSETLVISSGSNLLRFTNSFNPGSGAISAFTAGTKSASSELTIYKSSTETIEPSEPFEKGNLLKTVACISDIHIDAGIEQRNPPLRQSYINTCQAIARDEEADAVMIGGDTTSSHYGAQYTKEVFQNVKNAVNEKAKSASTKGYVLYANGNHDYSSGDGKDFNSGDYRDVMEENNGRFLDALYSDEEGEKLLAYHYLLGGIHYVVLNTEFITGDNHSNYAYAQAGINWVNHTMESIGKEKLTIFLTHYPLRDSRNISAQSKGMEQTTHNSIKAILKDYPNLINVYGHDHGGAYIYNDTFERVTPYTLEGNVIHSRDTNPTGFVSSYMGSMSQYGTDTGYSFGSGESPVVQALMIYVYENGIELQMKNYGTKTMPKELPESYIYQRNVVLEEVEVTYRAGNGGKIKASDGVLKTEIIHKAVKGEATAEGTTAGVTAVPEAGYRFVEWTVDGETATTELTRTDSNIMENKTVVAIFEPITVKSITLTPGGPAMIKPGETLKISAAVAPTDALNKDEVIWGVSPEGFVELKPVEGDSLSVHVKGMAAGTVTVTATAKDAEKPVVQAITLSIENDITKPAVTSVRFANKKDVELNIKGTITRKAAVSPKDATDQTIVYTTGNKKVASVDKNGKVTAKAVGIATIKATCNGKSDTYRVKVKPAKVKGLSVKSTAKKKATVKWNKVAGTTGYEIQCSTSSKNLAKGKPIKIKKGGTVTKTITKLAGGKTVYMQIRAYWKKGKNTIYGDYTGIKSCKVKK